MTLILATAITFLAPVAGLIGAAIALPVLLLLYFLKLRRRPVRVSSTLLWFDAARDLQVNTPFRVLRFSWLLLLQLLILSCFVLALARPAIEAEFLAPERLVLVIDRSASMSAQDVRTSETQPAVTRLDAAKERARSLIARLPSSTEVMLISFGAASQTNLSFTRDRGALRSAVNQLTPTDEPGNLAAALRVVRAFTTHQSEAEEVAPPRVVLLSDGGFSQSDAALAAGLGDVEFDFVQIGPAPDMPKDNVGIVALNARRDIEQPSTVRIFVRVQRAGASPGTVPLVTRVNDTPVAAANIEFAAPTNPTDLVEQSEVFTIDLPGSALVSVTAQVDDALQPDNSAAVFVQELDAPSILLIQPNTPSSALDYIPVDVLESLNPASLDILTIAQYTQRAQAGTLNADLIVFDRVRPPALPAAPSISFGAGLPIPGLAVSPQEDAATPAQTAFTFWQRTHPIMRFVALSGVTVFQPMQLDVPEESAGTGDSTRARFEVLARGESGPLIVSIEQQGVRRLVIGFSLDDSTWWRDPSFPVFVQNATDYLSRRAPDQAAMSIHTGDSVAIRAQAGVERINVTGPVSLQRSVESSQRSVTVGPFPLAGVYRIEGAIEPDSILPVSLLNELESSIITSPRVRFAGRDAEASSLANAAPREIWHWFVLAALVLLAIEWMTFAWQMRI